MPRPQSLTEKHRPRMLSDVVGQGHVVWALAQYLEAPYPTGILLHGPTGVGKSSVAHALKNELGVNEAHDMVEIDSGNQDAAAVEWALSTLRYRPMGGPWRMLLVEECDWMSPKVANLWLTALERLPSHAFVVFTTNRPEKLEARFVDRCLPLPGFQSDGATLAQDAQALIDRVWAAECGKGRPPRLEQLPDVVDGAGRLSFRRCVSALQALLRNEREPAFSLSAPRGKAPRRPLFKVGPSGRAACLLRA